MATASNFRCGKFTEAAKQKEFMKEYWAIEDKVKAPAQGRADAIQHVTE